MRARPRTQVLRQDRRLRVFLLEVFEDGEGLEELGVAVDQRRHHRLRIDRRVAGGVLVALLQVQEAVLAGQPLDVERDPHAEARLRAEVGIELHHRLSPFILD